MNERKMRRVRIRDKTRSRFLRDKREREEEMELVAMRRQMDRMANKSNIWRAERNGRKRATRSSV